MTLDFYGKEFDKYERQSSTPYVGYFSPDGKLVDYNTELGGSHSTLGNIVSWTFLLWVKESNAFKDLGLQDVEMSASLDMKTGVVKNASIPVNKYNEETNLSLLQEDLLTFLKRVETNPELLKIIRSKIEYGKLPEYIKRDHKLPLDIGESVYEIESVLGRDNTRSLLLYLKDICVSYLGYDSIEQVKPDGKFLTFPPYYALFPDDFYPYYEKPRIITSPNKNINQRFYNYLLMDYKIESAPRYVFDLHTNQFELEPMQSYLSEKDDIYREEIDAIRRLVPLKERPKYFR